MRAFFQKHKGEFANINVLTAYLGFRELGYCTDFFEFDDLDTLELDQDTVVVGSIIAVVKALNKLGVEPPALLSIPGSLMHYAKRHVWHGTIGEARTIVDTGGSLFIKPIPNDRKLFGGSLLSSFRDLIATASLPADYPIVCSEPVSMLSEYRVFVLKGNVIGCRHYKGDFRLFPDFRVIDSAIRDFSEAPSGYGIDFAVTASGDTILVEVNEGFSLGCYGLPALPYSSLLETRWNELLQSRRN
jgi:hypothetical protein